jgi:hypothetical protein
LIQDPTPRLIEQLDTLIPVIALSHEEVFDLFQSKVPFWYTPEDVGQAPKTYLMYRSQILNGAFLLGYSYFEAYLADLVRMIYHNRPAMLPKKGQLEFRDVLRCTDYNCVIQLMIEREVSEVFHTGMSEVVSYFEQKLKLNFADVVDHARIEKGRLIRNCLVHNMARVDANLSLSGGMQLGELIVLDSSDVHGFGLDCRKIAQHLSAQVLRITPHEGEKNGV